MRWVRWCPLSLALLGLLAVFSFAGPALLPPAGMPAAGVGAAAWLPPGSRAMELALAEGGFLRAPRIEVRPTEILLTGNGKARHLPPLAATGPPALRRVWLGTDRQGRDMLALLAAGGRTSLLAALAATACALLLGLTVGVLGGTAPVRVAWPFDLLSDGLLSLPRLLTLLALAAALRQIPGGIPLAIGLTSWMGIGRLVRERVSTVERGDMAMAARAAGCGPLRLALRHLLPPAAAAARVAAPLLATEAILLEASLSFLGLGPAGPPSWGGIVAQAHRSFPTRWWAALFPGLLILVAAEGFHRLAHLLESAPSSEFSA